MPKRLTKEEIDKIIRNVSELTVLVKEEYFSIGSLPEIRQKLDEVFYALPELTADYKTVSKVIFKEEPKNGE